MSLLHLVMSVLVEMTVWSLEKVCFTIVSMATCICGLLCTASKTCMKLMQKYVIPKISEDWEEVAAFLDYPIRIKNDIKAANK